MRNSPACRRRSGPTWPSCWSLASRHLADPQLCVIQCEPRNQRCDAYVEFCDRSRDGFRLHWQRESRWRRQPVTPCVRGRATWPGGFRLHEDHNDPDDAQEASLTSSANPSGPGAASLAGSGARRHRSVRIAIPPKRVRNLGPEPSVSVRVLVLRTCSLRS